MTFNEIDVKVKQDAEFKKQLMKNKIKGWRRFSGYLVTPKKKK